MTLRCLDGGMTGHAESDDDVNFMGLTLLADAPTTRCFNRNSAGYRNTYRSVGINLKIAALDQFEQVLRHGC